MFSLDARNRCKGHWIAAALLSCCACHGQPGPEINPHTIGSNLQLRISRNDPGDIVAAPQQSRSAVRIAQGGDQLLRDCMEHRESWLRDAWIGRLAHREPSTIGCGERSSPGLHVVSRYDFAEHAKQYLSSTFGPRALEVGVSFAIASSAFHDVSGLGPDSGSYRNRIAANLASHTIAESIEFGTSALLQQEQEFSHSGERGFKKRARYALYRTFVVPGRDGDELAFPRLAAAAGTAWIEHHWHPWQDPQPNAWTQAGWVLARYLFRSYWTEFKPEILHATRQVFRRHGIALPVAGPQSLPADPVGASSSEDIAEETHP